MFKRSLYRVLHQRLEEPRRFIQVLAGPRQTGKTTLARQVLEDLSLPGHYASADEPALKDRNWIEQQWEAAHRFLDKEKPPRAAVLVLDEIQKIPGWSEAVKRLWDQDTARRLPLHVVLLGSAPLLVQQGLSESLAGRFEVIPVTHWSFSEMREAFGWSVEQFIYFGGYPGAASLISQPTRWRRYILDSLVETTLFRDILLMQRVDKPALLRRLFELGCSYSGQVLSYTKMLGQLQDAGNTVTLAHYLDLLNGAGLLSGLSKYSGQKVRQRGSSPKFIVHNTALISAQSDLSFRNTRAKPEYWGRLVESTVGSHLLSGSRSGAFDLHYWLDRNHEVDFVLVRESRVVAIEVKSGTRRTSLPGIEALSQHTKIHRKLLVGGQGIPLDEFLLADPGSVVAVMMSAKNAARQASDIPAGRAFDPA